MPPYEAATTSPPFSAPARDDAGDGRGREIGPVGEDDDRRIGPVRQRGETAAERCARPALPVRAADDTSAMVRIRFERVRALDHDDLVHRRPGQPVEDVVDQQLLLGSAESRRRSGGEDDRADHVDAAVTCSTTHDPGRCAVAGRRDRRTCRSARHGDPADDMADDGVVGRE